MIRVSTLLVRVSPTALELPFLQDAEQLDLELGRGAVDLVEEDAAGVRGLEPAGPVVDGAGERALDVAEQLALEQALGQGAAVDADVRAGVARAEVVDGAGDQLLAGPGLADDQDAGARRGDLVGDPVHLRHRRTGADDSRQRRAVPAPGRVSIIRSGHHCASFPRGDRPSWETGPSRPPLLGHQTAASLHSRCCVASKMQDQIVADHAPTAIMACSRGLGMPLRDWGSRKRERSLPRSREPGARPEAEVGAGAMPYCWMRRPAMAGLGRSAPRPRPGKSARRGQFPDRRPPAAGFPGRPPGAGRTAGCSGRAWRRCSAGAGSGFDGSSTRSARPRCASGIATSLRAAAAGSLAEFSAIRSAGSASESSGSNGLPGRAAIWASSSVASRAYAVRSDIAQAGRPAPELLFQERRVVGRHQELDSGEARPHVVQLHVQVERADDVDRNARGTGVGAEVSQRVGQPPVTLEPVCVHAVGADGGAGGVRCGAASGEADAADTA